MTTLSDSDRGTDQARQATAAPRPIRRAVVIVIMAIGLGLVVAPFAFNMFSRAPKGATMLADFKPFMTSSRLAGFHADIAEIDSAVREIDAKKVAPTSTNSEYASFDAQWPAIHSHMSDLLDKVTDNLGNYNAVAALPSFRLFPWFFVAPGAVIVAVGALALRPSSRRAVQVVLVALSIGLIAAPMVFHMFSRAPQGGRMMTAFTTIETTQNVENIQGYFSSMAVGQGAIRLEIVPALERSGESAQQVATQLPAATALDHDWVHILNDMTPMIGAMSDNVGNYQAIKALPPFPLFPWFFVIPAALVAGLALFIPRKGRP